MIYLFVTIDTECDKGPLWKVQQPFKFDGVVKCIPTILWPLFEKYRIKPTFLLSPEVMAHEGSISLFKSLGDKIELGTHLHSEYIEPEANWNATATENFQSDYSPNIEKSKLTNLTELFKKKFGYEPRSFRAGRFGIGPHSLKFLEDLGYRVDSSVTPTMYWNRRRKMGVNFLGAPDYPYFPDASDFRRSGSMSILEIPVSVYNSFRLYLPNFYTRILDPFKPLHGLMLGNFLKLSKKNKWFRPTFANENELIEFARKKIKKDDRTNIPTVLNMMFHNVEFWPKASPYTGTMEHVQILINRMDAIFSYLRNHNNIESVGLSEFSFQ